MGYLVGIVSVSESWGIGKDNNLLFNIPEDMAFFKGVTDNGIVCMGENTLMSLPNSKPLKNRVNIVMTERDHIDNCITVHSVDEVLDFANDCREAVYVIGGGNVYNQLLPYMDMVFVTKVFADKEADTYFDNLDQNDKFTCEPLSNIINTNNNYKIQFLKYTRRDN